MCDLTKPIFTSESKARKHLERIRWPDGPACPHCGSINTATKLKGKSTRPGVYKCRECRKPFSVTVGTVYERSKIPLHKWLLATHLLCSSKKGISTHQLHRMLGLPYKTAWFMTHRIREGMRELSPNKDGGLGGQNKVVEVDETFVGGKAKNRAFKAPPKKEAVVGLVERGGKLRSFHVPEVTSKTLRPILVSHIDRKSYLMTDKSVVYPAPGEEFAGHGTVNHSAKEYVRGEFWHTNTIENAFSLLKRGITGTYHHVSQQHLRRYLGEFDFRFNHKNISDAERAEKAPKGIEGKRFTYRRIDETANG